VATEPEEDRLLSIAGAIVEGTPIQWDREQLGATDEDADVLRELRTLEGIVTAHRQVMLSRSSAATIGGDRTDPAAPEPELSAWAHLSIIEKIGEGSFGAVYRAHDPRLDTDVALKLLRSGSNQSLAAAQVLKEARFLARVRHPNVVRVFGADDSEDRVGFWMELVRGRTLEELLRTQGRFGAREAASIGVDLCRALAAIHRAGLLHGDIKAHNVMREEGGRTVLTDFGTGGELVVEASWQSGELRGTPAYLAPEVLQGQPRSQRSDVYALGVLLYHLVTKGYPIFADTNSELIRTHERRDRRLLRDERPDLPDEFVRVVEHAIAEDPDERYSSAGAFEAALAPIEGPTKHDGRPATPVRIAWVVSVVLAIGALVVLLLPRSNGPKPAARSHEDAITQSTASQIESSPTSSAVAYDVSAAFYRVSGTGRERLSPGSRIVPGDQIFLNYEASVPTHLYVVNEPEVGDPFLLFPLKSQGQTNPVLANRQVRLPGSAYWQVTSAGGREHFLVFASPQRIEAFERAFADLPEPKAGQQVTAAPLPTATVDRLRGVGGLVPEPSQPPTPSAARSSRARLAPLFTSPLPEARETVSGLWVRQITFENP
jgi:serine/threonine-protein kinase